MGGKVSTQNSLGQGCSSVEIDEQIMNAAGYQVYETLVRLQDCGVNFKWDNSEILHWYSTEGVALKSKSKFRDLPAAIVYLLRRNDLKMIAEGQHTLDNIQSLERMRSEEIKNLRAQIEAFNYDKLSWARQSKAMEAEIKLLKQKLNLDKRYTSALEDCCGDAGFPVTAIKEAVSRSKCIENYDQDVSEDEDSTLTTRPKNFVKTDKDLASTVHTPIAERQLELSHHQDDDPLCISKFRPGRVTQRQTKTCLKRDSIPRKSVKISVVKTVRSANNDITTITRALSCEECLRHKEVIGLMPRRGPFQSYWDKLMLQASVYNLEPRDVWQIVLLTIPDELHSKIPQDLRSGTILERQLGETNNDIYERLKEVLLQMRGPPQAEWHRILSLKQTSSETFETFSERMWVAFKEYSGVENCHRNHEILLQLLRSNAGPLVQNALALGGDPPQNTFDALVEWATKIEERSKTTKTRFIAATQWETDEVDVMICDYCHRPGHLKNRCFKLISASQLKPNRKMSKFRKSPQNRSETADMRRMEVNQPPTDFQATLEQLTEQT